ncbi:MAG: hypothetical protein QM783_09900 [Phycisphaerales bacterium]
MSIQARLDDAQLLWDSGRQESALVLLLTAVAACSERQTKITGEKDGAKFERFLRSKWWPKLSVEFRGELCPIETVFYKWMRCKLVHEGNLPVDVQIMPGKELSVAQAAPQSLF